MGAWQWLADNMIQQLRRSQLLLFWERYPVTFAFLPSIVTPISA